MTVAGVLSASDGRSSGILVKFIGIAAPGRLHSLMLLISFCFNLKSSFRVAKSGSYDSTAAFRFAKMRKVGSRSLSRPLSRYASVRKMSRRCIPIRKSVFYPWRPQS